MMTFGVQVYAQDSLILIIEKAYEEPNPNKSLELLSRIQHPELLVDDLNNKYLFSKGVAFGKLGNADSSLHYLDRCIEYAESSSNDYFLVRAYNSKGVLFRIQGRHEESLDAFQKALSIAEPNTSKEFEVMKTEILGNIGGIFYQLKKYDRALSYAKLNLQKAYDIADTSEIAYGNLRMAIVYQSLDSLKKSLAYNRKASAFLEILNDFTTLVYVENTLGAIQKKQNKLDSSVYHQKRALDFAVKSGENESIAHTTLALAESYFEQRKIAEAIKTVNSGLDIAVKGNFPIHTKNAHDLLYRIAVLQKNFKKALEERNAYLVVSDSLNTAEAQERLAEVETKYETAKKEAEITRLSLENELHQSNLARSRNIQIGLVVIGVLIIILLVVFFTLRHKKQQIEKEAQELQMEALKKRFMELHASPAELAVALEFNELNNKLNTQLTEREFEALKLSIEGKTNSEIADQLFISVSTVKFHLRNTYSKMGVGNRKEAFQLMLKT